MPISLHINLLISSVSHYAYNKLATSVASSGAAQCWTWEFGILVLSHSFVQLSGMNFCLEVHFNSSFVSLHQSLNQYHQTANLVLSCPPCLDSWMILQLDLSSPFTLSSSCLRMGLVPCCYGRADVTVQLVAMKCMKVSPTGQTRTICIKNIKRIPGPCSLLVAGILKLSSAMLFTSHTHKHYLLTRLIFHLFKIKKTK